MSRFDLDVLYARAKAKLWSKVERLRSLAQEGPLKMSDFGTRRRHGFLVAALVRRGVAGGPRRQLHRHLERQARDGHRPRGDRHQRPRAADGLCGDRRGRRRAARGALRGAAGLGARCMAAICSSCCPTVSAPPPSCATRPDWVADWKGARPEFETADRGRARADRLVGAARPRSARKADRALRRDGHRVIEESVRALRGQINVSIGWGTNLTNDFSGCAPAGRTDSSRRSRWFARSSRPTDGRRSNSRTIPTRRWERRRRSSAISACSARTAWRSIRSRCEGGWPFGDSGLRRCLSSRRWRSTRPGNGSRRTGRPTRACVKGPMGDFVEDAAARLARAKIPIKGDRKTSLFRIHRDVRFAKNKDPYKTNAGVAMTRSGSKNDPGVLYFHLSPEECFFAAGFHQPEPAAAGQAARGRGPVAQGLQDDDREAQEGGPGAQRRGCAQANAARLRGGRRSRDRSRRCGSGISSA